MAEQQHTTPYLSVNKVEGGNRQGVPYDSWAIVKKGIPTTEFNQAGEELIETVPMKDGYDAVREKLKAHEKSAGLPVDEQAWMP